jgi:RND family efflux transporter MFP subunit
VIALKNRSRAALRRTSLALSCFALTAVSLGAATAAQGPPAAVRVDAVRLEPLTNRRPVTGDLRAAHRGQVATREKGLIVELLVDEGQAVQTGTVLARLDATQLELDLAVLRAQRPPSEANVRERRANLERAQSDLDSLAALVERKAANPKELLDARSDLAAAEARLSASEALLAVIDAQLAKLEQRIVDMTIRAPFDGTVVQTLTELGSWAAEGSPVVELLSTNQLEVWLEVPQDLFAAVTASGSTIEIRVGSGDAGFAMKDYRVIPDIDLRGRAFRVVGKASTEIPLAAGMSVIAMVPTGEQREMLTVHRDAILRNQVSSFVYGVIPGGEGKPAVAAPIDVELLFQTETRAVVRSAQLRAGTEVVVEGNERLYPMAPVAPIRGSGGPAGGSDKSAGAPAAQPEGSSR